MDGSGACAVVVVVAPAPVVVIEPSLSPGPPALVLLLIVVLLPRACGPSIATSVRVCGISITPAARSNRATSIRTVSAGVSESTAM